MSSGEDADDPSPDELTGEAPAPSVEPRTRDRRIRGRRTRGGGIRDRRTRGERIRDRRTRDWRTRGEWAQLAVALAITAVALAPVVALVLQRAGHPYLPTQDQGVLDMRVRDVWSFSANTPLTGPYSRFGWQHPGPVMYYALALFSGIFGEPAWATLVGGALLQAVAIVWTARLSWSAGGLKTLVPWMSVLMLAYGATGAWILQEVWNPHVAFPFFVLFLLYCSLVASGDGSRLIGLLVVSTLLVQTHIGYVLLVAVLLSWAVGRLVLARRRLPGAVRRDRLARLRWRAGIAFVVALWVPPLVIDPIVHFPGNVYVLARSYIGAAPGPRQPILGLRTAAGYMAAEFRWLPTWLGGTDPVNPFTSLTSPASPVWLLIPALLLVAAFAIARARGRPGSRILIEQLAITLIVGVASLALLRGAPSPYLFYWRIIVGVAVTVLSLVVIVEALSGGRRRPLALLDAVLAVGIAISSAGLTADVAAARGPISPMAPVARSILAQLERSGAMKGRILLRTWGSTLGGLDGALVDQLTRQGVRVFVDKDLGYQFGQGREASVSAVSSVWYVIEESELFSLVSSYPGGRVLAISHPLSPSDQAELVRLQRLIWGRLAASGHGDLVHALGNPYVAMLLPKVPGVTPGEIGALSQLNGKVQRAVCLCAVVAFPAQAVPAALAPPPA